MTIERLTVPAIAAPHAFLGRTGGVSRGLYASLNLGTGSDDDPALVSANRDRAVAAVLPGATLVTVRQVHSADVVAVDAPIALDRRPEADAMVTRTPGLLLGILTADCAPLLLHDPDAGVAGAAHAGWKGALGGIVARTVEAMAALGADPARIRAAVGPCIARRSYEVDAGFHARFLGADESHDRFFAPGRPGHFQFDLEGFVGAQCAAAGIGQVTLLGEDTYSQAQRFYSYRRTTHAREADYGRQASLIGIGA